MARDLVPELHDVLKLTVLKHNYDDFGPFQSLSPDTPTWRGVLEHHCDETFLAYPTGGDTFLLHMADGLASGFSRHPQNIKKQEARQEAAWTIHRLWKPETVVSDQRLSAPDDIAAMLKLVAADPSFDEFFDEYQGIFQSRTEDAHPGMNVTTLETHVRLVGRLYRFLRQSSSLAVRDQEIEAAARRGPQAVADLREQKKKEWQLYLLRCRLRLLGNPYRARDMNIFALVEEFLDDVSARLGDNLLFASTQELLLYCDDLKILAELSALATPRGILLHVERDRQRLDMLSLKLRKPEFENMYSNVEATLAPPICEICQMQRATKVWPDDHLVASQLEAGELPQGTDFLCESCFAIRCRPSKLKKLAHWEEWAEGDLIWARFGLDFDRLQETLRVLYLRYLRSLDPGTKEERAEVRFSLIAEFQKDHGEYLAHVRDLLLEHFGNSRAELVLPDLLCIQAESGSDVFAVLRCFEEAVEAFFPAFLGESGCPLKISLAFCGVKHPFFEVWQQWQEQESELEVVAVGHGRLQLEARHLRKFLQLADFRFRRSALHNLAEISRVSQQLAELRFRSGAEKGERETFQHLREFLPLGMTFDGILTLAKLVGG